MKLIEIRLKNYRQYQDCVISFSSDAKKKSFSIIQGVMGAGKSNILNAITWCLYDEEIHLTQKTEGKGLPLINTPVLDGLIEGEQAKVIVELIMEDDKKKSHTFKRTKIYEKQGNTVKAISHLDANASDGSYFQYWHQVNKDMEEVATPNLYLEQIMPRGIMEYFFFDGEQLDKYFTDAGEKKIREAVFDVSQITLLDAALKRLTGQRREIEKACENASPEVNAITKQMQATQASIDEAKNKLLAFQEERRKEQILREGIIKQLSDYPDVETLVKEKEEIVSSLEFIEEERDDVVDQVSRNIKNISPAVLCIDAVKYTRKLVEDGTKEGKYPPDISQEFVDEMLHKKQCLCCGRKIDSDDGSLENVKALQNKLVSKELTGKVTDIDRYLGNVIGEIVQFPDHQTELLKKIKKYDERIEALNNRSQELGQEIGDHSIEVVRNLKRHLDNVDRRRDRLVTQIHDLDVSLKEDTKLLDRLVYAHKKELKKQGDFEKLEKALEFIDEALKEGEIIKNEIVGQIRKKVENNTEEQFLRIVMDPEKFDRVSIDAEYNVSVMDHKERECLGTLSAGQRQVLALSFMAALNEVSGFQVPIVIDTPLGRISDEPSDKIAKNLPNYLDGRQVIMLVTDKEYKDVRKFLKDRVADEYRIKGDGSSQNMKLVNYS